MLAVWAMVKRWGWVTGLALVLVLLAGLGPAQAHEHQLRGFEPSSPASLAASAARQQDAHTASASQSMPLCHQTQSAGTCPAQSCPVQQIHCCKIVGCAAPSMLGRPVMERAVGLLAFDRPGHQLTYAQAQVLPLIRPPRFL